MKVSEVKLSSKHWVKQCEDEHSSTLPALPFAWWGQAVLSVHAENMHAEIQDHLFPPLVLPAQREQLYENHLLKNIHKYV